MMVDYAHLILAVVTPSLTHTHSRWQPAGEEVVVEQVSCGQCLASRSGDYVRGEHSLRAWGGGMLRGEWSGVQLLLCRRGQHARCLPCSGLCLAASRLSDLCEREREKKNKDDALQS